MSVVDFRANASERLRQAADALDALGLRPLYVSVRPNSVDVDSTTFLQMFDGEQTTGERDFPGSTFVRVYREKLGIVWGSSIYWPEVPAPRRLKKIPVTIKANP